MGVEYSLVNHTKREQICFWRIGASKAGELAGTPAASAITTWYMLENAGDKIAFVSDTYDDWPFPTGTRAALQEWPDVTNQVVDALIAKGVLEDHGKSYVDPDEPDTVFVRDLRNAWMPESLCSRPLQQPCPPPPADHASVPHADPVSVTGNQMNGPPDCPAPKPRWRFSAGLIGGTGLGIVFGGAFRNPGLGLIIGAGVGYVIGTLWSLNGGRHTG